MFNRPDLVKQTFPKIKEMQPKYLFLAADGPRKENQLDIVKGKECKEWVLAQIDWDCEVQTLFRNENLGCGLAVSGAITWFFKHVEMGIILEDDCLTTSGFYHFCSYFLDQFTYREDVMHISGGAFLHERLVKSGDYYFSKYPFCWGWATWKRSWEKFNYSLIDAEDGIKNLDEDEHEYWLKILSALRSNKLDSWAFRWNFALWMNNGKSLVSRTNFVKNIGFDPKATHTKSINSYYNKIAIKESVQRIFHDPLTDKINHKLDRIVFERYNLGILSFWDRLLKKVTKYGNS